MKKEKKYILNDNLTQKMITQINLNRLLILILIILNILLAYLLVNSTKKNNIIDVEKEKISIEQPQFEVIPLEIITDKIG